MKEYLSAIIALIFTTYSLAQITPDCNSAIPICNDTPVNGGTEGYGEDDFIGQNSSGCLQVTTTGSIESNSAWYRFRIGATGQLGFNISHDPMEDWDFALYKASSCSNLGEPIRCNFFDNSDQRSFTGVGEDPTGIANSVLYDDWLDVEAGEDYFLLINNFSNVNSGFSIQFSGDVVATALDCNIVDNVLGDTVTRCEYDEVILNAATLDATGYTWYEGDGVNFQLISGEQSETLEVIDEGFYKVEIELASGVIVESVVEVSLSPVPVTNPLNDEIFCLSETETIIDLADKNTEALGNQSSDYFRVSYHATENDAVEGKFPLSTKHKVPAGEETIYVRLTSKENPSCFDASQSFNLVGIEEPRIGINAVAYLCGEKSIVEIGDFEEDSTYKYVWNTGETTAKIVVDEVGTYEVTTTNNVGGFECEHTETISVESSFSPEIAEVETDGVPANSAVTIVTVNSGDYEFQLNDGEFQTENTFEDVKDGVHRVTINDLNGCGTLVEEIVVTTIPGYFSPNGDVLSEHWSISGLRHLNQAVVDVYDRYGKLLKQFDQYSPGWDGTYNGVPMPQSDYWFTISYINSEGNRVNAKYLKNHFTLKRSNP